MSLVTVASRKEICSPRNQIIELRLAHLSVKEYLLSDQLDAQFAPLLEDIFAQTAIASVCVAYLLSFDHWFPEPEIDASFPFARYCAQH